MTFQRLLLVACASTLVSFGAISIMRVLLRRFPSLLADMPNKRSLHTVAIRRIGGIAVVGSATLISTSLAILLAVVEQWQAWLLGTTLVLFAVSWLDDLAGLPAHIRLAVHFGATTALVLSTHAVSNWSPGTTVAYQVVHVVLFAWWTNLYNFMDGADGLAGGMSVFGFAAFAIAAFNTAQAPSMVAVISTTIAGASLGFLALNFAPAKIFLGDAGSIPLGFLAAGISWIGTAHGTWAWWFGPAVFSAFITDATVTIVRRIMTGKRFWEAHREHYYQRLILSGWTHRKTCLVYYFLMLMSAFCALSAKNSPHPWTWLLPLVITYASLIAVLEWRFHQEKKDGKNTET